MSFLGLGARRGYLRLALPCRRITLSEHWKMLYESFKVLPRGLPQATHASAWRKWEKWVPKLIRMIGFRQNFEIFPEAPGWPGWVFYDVFWCSGPLGTFLEWFWMNSGNFIFSWFFLKFWPQILNEGRSFHPARMNRFGHWWCYSKLKYYILDRKKIRSQTFS